MTAKCPLLIILFCDIFMKYKLVYLLHDQVETFLMNPTLTSKGGFRIIINGITFYKVSPIYFANDGSVTQSVDTDSQSRIKCGVSS